MAFTVIERDTSRTITSGTKPTVELRYVVRGVGTDPAKEDDQEALEALEATAPPTFLGLLRQDVRLEPISITDVSESIWDGEVSYAAANVGGDPPQPEMGMSVFTFDTGGGMQRITQSRATVGVFPESGTTAPDFKGAIGVTADSVEGVDIVVPVYQFTETHVLPDTTVSDAYKHTLMIMTGTTNSAPFRGFSTGEVLFLGAAGSKRADGDWEITFRFAGSFNETGITVGSIIGINKNGWDYLWVRYEDKDDMGAQSIVKQPTAAYVERVYRVTSFASLGI